MLLFGRIVCMLLYIFNQKITPGYRLPYGTVTGDMQSMY